MDVIVSSLKKKTLSRKTAITKKMFISVKTPQIDFRSDHNNKHSKPLKMGNHHQLLIY